MVFFKDLVDTFLSWEYFLFEMLLTKSKYLIGLQCPRYFWTAIHQKESIPEPDACAQFRFDEGTKIGELATKFYQEGIDLSSLSFIENLEKSEEMLKEKKPLFEAGFKFGDCYSRCDVLVPIGDEWDIVEVKSSTSVKEINYHDVAFQKYCYEGRGLKIRKCFLMHLNREYVRNGEIEINKLFVKTDITSEVETLMGDVSKKVNYLLESIKEDKMPEVVIGPQCKTPYECPLKECWDFLPENNVFDLYYGGKKSFRLFEEGIHAMKDIPEDFKLSFKQGIQKKCEVHDKIHINKEEIKGFLEELKYPLYYLDFETFSNGVPMFNGLRPYSQIPFQFSLHVVENKGEEPKHHEFLYNGKGDPRREFITELKSVLGTAGSVVVYNQGFENARLKELAEAFPEFNSWVLSVRERIVDLLVVFRNFSYYNPSQKGSASIKKVLPALCGKDYSDLEIGDGTLASVNFYNMVYGNFEGDKEEMRKNLLKYCERDTFGEILIVDRLREIAS
tara:strand:+ start:1557 stop:3068 length:1512 start_codon:yes stop_codon:yes gene_type:complete